MKYTVEKHKRQSLRLKGYDYTKRGAYYVTICTQKRQCLLGTINDGKMLLNHAGEMVQKIWNNLSIRCPEIVIDEFIIMPNHVHGIIFIVGAPLVGAHSVESWMGDKDRAGTRPDDRAGTRPDDRAGTRPDDRAGTRPAPTSSLGDVVGIFKSISTHQYSMNVNANNWPAFPGKLWQRNYYERIIRNDDELIRIREYILNNPQQWDYEDNNPLNLK